ncbi:MAG: sodium/proline symporter [Myxococcota bacterium]
MEALLAPDRWLIVVTFFSSLLIFTGIGAVSAIHRKHTTKDYLLTGRSMPAWLVALSAVATLNSGFMFVGQIGLTYRVGLSSLWWLVGWAVGDLIAWLFVYPKLRRLSEEHDEISVLALVAPRRAAGRNLILSLLALLSVFYLATYAAAQLKAGSTALESIFGMPASTGAVLGGVIVVIYCYAGGIRASIWTDAAQSVAMFGSMAVLAVVASLHVGGPGALMPALATIGPELPQLWPADLHFGFGIYLLGMVFGGLGVIGQPHILVRSMTIDDPAHLGRARLYYFLWLIPFYAMAIWVGLHARVILPDLMSTSVLGSEHALPLLSIELLPDVLIGLMLAGLFSATMSTADSQIIACTSAVTQDLEPRWSSSYAIAKLATLVFTAIALLIALSSRSGVFELVLDAWAVLSCTLGPLLVVRLLGLPCTQGMGMILVAAGLAVSHFWLSSDYASATYVNFPGMVAVFALYAVLLGVRWVRRSGSG